VIIDASSRSVVGGKIASQMQTQTVLKAIEIERWGRGNKESGLRCHSGQGNQFISIHYGERVAEIVAAPSIGNLRESFGNGLAETVNGHYKAELVR